LVISSPAFAQICPIGSTCNPWETYIYGKGAASQPFAGSLKIPAVPNASASSAQFIAANLFADLTSAQTMSSKTFTAPTINGATLAGTITLSGITGSTQCLQVNSSGTVSGTGAICGSGGGGGSGTVASSTIGQIPVYTAATTVTGSPNLTFAAGLFTLNTNASSSLPAFAGGTPHLLMAGPDASTTRLGQITFNNANGSSFISAAAGGTGSAPTALPSGSRMGRLPSRAMTERISLDPARMTGFATETQTPSAHGSNLVFGVTPIGSTTIQDILFLDSTGLTVDNNSVGFCATCGGHSSPYPHWP
jgi:hypothetical protein